VAVDTGLTAVPAVRRLVIATLVAAVAGHFTYVTLAARERPNDFAQLWFGAGALVRGENPYDVIGPGRALNVRWPLYYPLPSVVAAVPASRLPYRVASAGMAALGFFALAWALMGTGYAPLLGLLSLGAATALYLVQWSPLLAGAIVLTPLSALWIVKPTVGFACFVARPTRWAMGGGLVLTAIAFLVDPAWLASWRAALDSPNVAPANHAGHVAAIQFPGGILILAALTRWRRWEARLLVALACVPQTMLLYETVPLLLIPRGWREVTLLTALTWGVHGWVESHGPLTFAQTAPVTGRAVTLALYLPCVLMVLRRPNEAPAARGNADTAPRPSESTTCTATTNIS
jgi:hypothetical protein